MIAVILQGVRSMSRAEAMDYLKDWERPELIMLTKELGLSDRGQRPTLIQRIVAATHPMKKKGCGCKNKAIEPDKEKIAVVDRNPQQQSLL